jgi:hypothetical protein
VSVALSASDAALLAKLVSEHAPHYSQLRWRLREARKEAAWIEAGNRNPADMNQGGVPTNRTRFVRPR